MLDTLKHALGDVEDARKLGVEIDARTAMLMACSHSCIKLLSTDGRMIYMSRNGRCVMEIDNVAPLIGREWWDLWPEETRVQLRQAVAGAAQGKFATFVAECPTAVGTPACWEVSVSGVPDADGKIREIVAISDLTERPVSPLEFV